MASHANQEWCMVLGWGFGNWQIGCALSALFDINLQASGLQAWVYITGVYEQESSLAKIGMGSRGMHTTDISYFDSLKPYPWLSSVRTLEMKIENYIHKLPLPIVLPGSYLVTTADRTHRDNQGSNACAGTPFLSSRNEPNHDWGRTLSHWLSQRWAGHVSPSFVQSSRVSIGLYQNMPNYLNTQFGPQPQHNTQQQKNPFVSLNPGLLDSWHWLSW